MIAAGPATASLQPPPSRLRGLAGPRLIGIALAVALVGGAAAQESQPLSDSSPALLQQQQLAFRHALRTLTPVIVRIDTIGGAQPVERLARPGSPSQAVSGFRQADGPTTGLIYSSDGYILTSSFNFIRDPVVITVTLADGRRFVARLVARDLPARLALLKIDAADLPTPRWVDFDDLRAGQWALVAGFGHGSAEPTVSVGVLSALRRMSGQAVQTDAKTSPANYGGPLFDIEGRVIGICVPMGAGEDELAGVEWYDSGIGFAIHHEHIRRRLPRLRAGEDLRRGLLGINLDQSEPVVASSADLRTTAAPSPVVGVRIIGEPRGPATDAGLEAGDIITQIDGEPTPNMFHFRCVVARKAAGDTIRVDYDRGGKAASVTLELASADDFRAVPTSQPK